MHLLIDAGNTRIKLGWRLPDGSREPTAVACTHTDLTTCLPAWLASLPVSPTQAWGVNVAGEHIGQTITRLLQTHGACPVQWHHSPPAALGLVNSYRNPGQLGPDRWAALLALWAHPRYRLAPAPAGCAQVLASFGTATTVDTLTPDGSFAGGLILPGVRLMLQSLASGTANLPLAQGVPVDFPTHTDQAIASGVMAAQAGAVLRQLLATRARYPEHALRLAVTGGAWPEVEPQMRSLLAAASLEPALVMMDNPVLDGLAMLAATATP